MGALQRETVRAPATFRCPVCARLLPEYFRGVWAFGICPRDHCYECMIEFALGGITVRRGCTPTLDEIVAEVKAGKRLWQISQDWGVSARTLRRSIRSTGR